MWRLGFVPDALNGFENVIVPESEPRDRLSAVPPRRIDARILQSRLNGFKRMAIYEIDGIAPELPGEDKCFVAENATVVGRVRIGVDVSIWFGTVVRGDNEWIEIGEGSNIQDNSMLHADPGKPLTIGKNCTVGHKVILHGCTIEDDCLIGMGAIIMNGAIIRKGSVVGAGAVITEDKEFAANSMILGAPAKAIREVKPEMQAGIRRATMSYVNKGRLYPKALRRID